MRTVERRDGALNLDRRRETVFRPREGGHHRVADRLHDAPS